jgi:hypothetical protein
MSERTRFVITLKAAPGVDDAAAFRALKWLLKKAKRQYGLTAIDAIEVRAPTTVADAFAQLRDDVNRRLRGRT